MEWAILAHNLHLRFLRLNPKMISSIQTLSAESPYEFCLLNPVHSIILVQFHLSTDDDCPCARRVSVKGRIEEEAVWKSRLKQEFQKTNRTNFHQATDIHPPY